MLVLGIETSCDETSVALVRLEEGKVNLLAQEITSQIEHHRPFGGVVPEVATRQHLLHLKQMTDGLLKKTDISLAQIDCIGVTRGPGLASSLMIGLGFVKGLALATGKAWVGVNHLEGHLFSPFLALEKLPAEPHVALIVSGGHTLLIEVKQPYECRLLGSTLDDAAGEAFDKGAKMLGLEYPGGPQIEKMARSGNAQAVPFPRPMLDDGSFNFSFSGLKTALRVFLTKHPEVLTDAAKKADVCASYQQAIIDVLVAKGIKACRKLNCKLLTLSGGVSCNQALRQALEKACAGAGIACLVAPPKLSTDNAGMIAVVAAARFAAGEKADWEVDIEPNLRLALKN